MFFYKGCYWSFDGSPTSHRWWSRAHRGEVVWVAIRTKFKARPRWENSRIRPLEETEAKGSAVELAPPRAPGPAHSVWDPNVDPLERFQGWDSGWSRTFPLALTFGQAGRVGLLIFSALNLTDTLGGKEGWERGLSLWFHCTSLENINPRWILVFLDSSLTSKHSSEVW